MRGEVETTRVKGRATMAAAIALAMACVLASGARAQPTTETCVESVQRVSGLCSGVLSSTSPFDLLNCCEGAKDADERGCFCDSGVALALGTSYDATLEVLESGCSLNIATYGSVACHARDDSNAVESNDDGVSDKDHGAPQPVSYWTFQDAPNSNVATDKMNNVSGLYSAEVGLGFDGPGSETSSAYFSGRDSYVLIPYTPLLNTANFTVSTTLKPEGAGERPKGTAESVVENFAETSETTIVIGGYGLERHWLGGGGGGEARPLWAFVVGTPIGPLTVYSETEAREGKWAQVTGAYDAAARRAAIYVNGTLEGVESLGQQIMLGNPENDLLIGNGNRLLPSGATTAPYVGYISQAGFWDQALDEPQAKAVFEAVFPSAGGGGGGFPLWATILISCVAVLVVLAALSVLGIFLWRRRERRQAAAPSARRGPTANEQPALAPEMGNTTPLRGPVMFEEEREHLTPRGAQTPSATVHPRFRKIGSKISVTWN